MATGTGSTEAQVMACCLTAPSHPINRCWLTISKVQWQSPRENFKKAKPTLNTDKLEHYWPEFVLKSPSGPMSWLTNIFILMTRTTALVRQFLEIGYGHWWNNTNLYVCACVRACVCACVCVCGVYVYVGVGVGVGVFFERGSKIYLVACGTFY